MQAKKRVTLGGKPLHPKTYFTAQDLAVGKFYTVIIDHVEREEMHNPLTNQKETKPVLYLQKHEIGTVMGIELEESIAEAAGDWVADNWPGKAVVIFRTVVRKDKSGTKEGIRAKKPTPKAAADTAPIPVAHEDETTEYAKSATAIAPIDWGTATVDDLRIWAATQGIDTPSVNSFLENAGGSVPDAHAKMQAGIDVLASRKG
jgi:hypothetical protein